MVIKGAQGEAGCPTLLSWVRLNGLLLRWKQKVYHLRIPQKCDVITPIYCVDGLMLNTDVSFSG